jgi:hypothetical protein
MDNTLLFFLRCTIREAFKELKIININNSFRLAGRK